MLSCAISLLFQSRPRLCFVLFKLSLPFDRLFAALPAHHGPLFVLLFCSTLILFPVHPCNNYTACVFILVKYAVSFAFPLTE